MKLDLCNILVRNDSLIKTAVDIESIEATGCF